MFDASWFPASLDRAITPGVGSRDEITWTLAGIDMAAFMMFYYFNDDTVTHNVTLDIRPVAASPVAQCIEFLIPAGQARPFLPERISGVNVDSRIDVPWFVMAPSVVTFRDLTALVTAGRVPRWGVRWMQRRMTNRGNPVVPAVVTL